MPLDVEPLRQAVRRICRGDFDVLMLTTSVQLEHLLRVAAESGVEQELRGALKRMVVASVGPTTSESLREHGIQPDFEPSHPKMGFLVNETAARAREILAAK